ncbi:uncharacterized protein LACBIDRAFT_321928 [Laccaria bicolor S238N-H82]|uniref:Predicted protein n=1 Tax=Laccaria bicolor (strain S238N-H82 / ATCC MYA-4686) TaxID=486041 RepID=B0CUN4_LACBS|nr:uncharacterized protein LACBIDRAFT_321928 [Laccaria bicolor S238N-H82]EDR14122.1 predicted protein [Laccaria bicolor S238N-H82]|eukprot:XP_001874681.1 predicted protein [Laccaria bicolor S238N-H82]
MFFIGGMDLNLLRFLWSRARSDTPTLREDAPQNRLRNGQGLMELGPQSASFSGVWAIRTSPRTRQTVQIKVLRACSPQRKPSCASISINEDLFGYYFTSRKRSDKPFTKPSTLRGDLFGYYFTSRKRSDKPFTKPSTLRGDLPVARFPST